MPTPIKLIDRLSRETLEVKYTKEKKSLDDISKEYGCTRQYICKLLKKHNIPRRQKSEAILNAYNTGKFSVPGYHINEAFFSCWSSEMSYVLGLLFTDGCPSWDNEGKLKDIRISLNDLSLLEKIRSLMGSNHRIFKLKQKGLYCLRFGRERILKDLVTLGMVPNKSHNIEFPAVPVALLHHFIRGCWDGDGSVFEQYYNKKRIEQ